jgi:hypothetical protein
LEGVVVVPGEVAVPELPAPPALPELPLPLDVPALPVPLAPPVDPDVEKVISWSVARTPLGTVVVVPEDPARVIWTPVTANRRPLIATEPLLDTLTW